MKTVRERLDDAVDEYPDQTFLTADGFDDAVLGLDVQNSRVVYSVRRCLKILMAEGMSAEDASEYFEFNTRGAHMGDQTPIWCDDEWLADAEDDGGGSEGPEDIKEVRSY